MVGPPDAVVSVEDAAGLSVGVVAAAGWSSKGHMERNEKYSQQQEAIQA